MFSLFFVDFGTGQPNPPSQPSQYGTQGHRNAGTHKHRGTEAQGLRGKGAQRPHPHHTTLYFTILECHSILDATVLYCTVLYWSVLYSIAEAQRHSGRGAQRSYHTRIYFAILEYYQFLYATISYCTILYCIGVYCIILYVIE